MAKKKTAAPAEEQALKEQDIQVRETGEQAQNGPGTAQEGAGANAGIGAQETPPGGAEGVLAAVNAANGLNLRAGPGGGYAVAEVLPAGARVAVLELPCGAEVPGWALVHTGRRTGWVDIRFIRELAAGETAG